MKYDCYYATGIKWGEVRANSDMEALAEFERIHREETGEELDEGSFVVENEATKSERTAG